MYIALYITVYPYIPPDLTHSFRRLERNEFRASTAFYDANYFIDFKDQEIAEAIVSCTLTHEHDGIHISVPSFNNTHDHAAIFTVRSFRFL